MKKYILLGATGIESTLFNQAISAHPQIKSLGQPFGGAPYQASIKCDTQPSSSEIYTLEDDAASFLHNSVFNPAKHQPCPKVVGFTILYDQARENSHSYGAWKYILKDKLIKIIHLQPRNFLRELIDLKIAIKTGFWLLKKSADGQLFGFGKGGPQILKQRPFVPPFEILPEEAEYFFLTTAAHLFWAKRAFANHNRLDIHYSRLRDQFDVNMCRVFRFLGVAMAPLEGTILDLALGNPRDQVSNYDELKAHFERSIFDNFE